MVEYLKPAVENMRSLSKTTGKPVLFTESGCRSRNGAAMKPSDWALPGTYNGQEQANYLEEVFQKKNGGWGFTGGNGMNKTLLKDNIIIQIRPEKWALKWMENRLVRFTKTGGKTINTLFLCQYLILPSHQLI